MKYRTFSDYQLGYSHVKNDTVCEDCAMSYTEPSGKYHICVASDGHSDNNCFRSSKGAKYGCESAIEILKRFFELYYEQGNDKKEFTLETEDRLKKSIKQCWDRKVFKDIEEHPITQDELQPLSQRVRAIYESGRGLQNIYGATFLAAAICEDFFVALHIGDGIVMCISPDGTYYEPLPYDEKSETGSPASLCDVDLFSRKDAFRCMFSKTIPQAVLVSSDGVGDCMDQLQFKEFARALIRKFEMMEQEDAESELNASQKKYLENCLKYWADKGNGAEDDCSLAGIYDMSQSIPEVKLPLDVALDLWKNVVDERNCVVKDYEKRKADMVSNIEKQMEAAANVLKETASTKDWIEAKEKIEQSKHILKNMQDNELEKLDYYEQKMQICEEYIRRAQGIVPIDMVLLMPKNIDEKYLVPDELFANMKIAQDSVSDNNEEEDIIEDEVPECTEKPKKKTIFSFFRSFSED